MADYSTATPNGAQLDINSLAQTLAYSGTFLSTQTVVYSGVTYVRTFTNNGTNITGISQWVAQ